jgi:aminopeptidase N
MMAPAPGVPVELAKERAALVSDVRYQLHFEVPASTALPVAGKVTVRWKLKSVPEGGLQLDFMGAAGEHITVPDAKPGDNVFTSTFTAADGPLNRRTDFLYTLFVPARAREAFPCFDQPDLKARFELSLGLPAGWKAVSNAPGMEKDGVWRFETSDLLATYQFAFAAGAWTVSDKGDGVRVFHRETDEAKALEGVAAVLSRGALARKWMEEYTGVLMPYKKLDYVVVPGFQYGGMEHPGALYLNARRTFLDAAATEDERLKRASLIAHEVAHLWFGDHVTMRWFDDVWLKEVYANFFADKIVAPEFASVDHRLRFLMQNHAYAYEVDRTSGTNPILQPLENLAGAGALYGPIVYQKSPVVMRQLEARLGPSGLRAGLREYLQKHGRGNATWDDLVAALAPYDSGDLKAWADAWVRLEGRPSLRAEVSLGPNGKSRRVKVLSEGPWAQSVEVAYGGKSLPAKARAGAVDAAGGGGLEPPRWLLPDAHGLGYGRMRLDAATRAWLLANVGSIEEPSTRGVAWLALWEDALDGLVGAAEFKAAIEKTLPGEEQELLVARLLRWHADWHWRFSKARDGKGEALFWRLANAAKTPSLKKTYLKAWARETADAAKLRKVWARELKLPGLALDDEEETSLALELAVRGEDVLDAQAARLSNPDRRARLEFLKPAALGDQAWFVPLRTPEGRRKESWVEDGLRLLHHPLREKEALTLLPETLRLLPEVKRTGDIFFPAAWLEAALSGHGSPEAAKQAADFLAAEGGRLDPRLKALCQARFDALYAAARSRAR